MTAVFSRNVGFTPLRYRELLRALQFVFERRHVRAWLTSWDRHAEGIAGQAAPSLSVAAREGA
jgi:hypothetical protein